MVASKHCIACGYHIIEPIYQIADQPLAALNLPLSEADAKNTARFPMDFHVCANCGHIFNVAFDSNKVPYENDSNLMYNKGSGWQSYMSQLADDIAERHTITGKTFVDIGCGDGGFLKLLLDMNAGVRCVAYEPGIEAENARKQGLKVEQDYFVPERDLPKLKPDFLVCRHVIEHMDKPQDFVEDIAHWCTVHGIFPIFIAEVPRIDKTVIDARTNDFLYEHVSNFTHFSFINMFERAGYEILNSKSAYGNEVIVVEARARVNKRLQAIAASSASYRSRVETQQHRVHDALGRLKAAGKSIAFWGGTGKGAAFLNSFELTVEDYPIVIDSDYNKVGRFVPGGAQEIRPPEYLENDPVDIIVITTQWRARDIYEEINRRGIRCEKTMVLFEQELQEYKGESL